ncbi:P-type conjugative transfer protein TrbG [Sphingomonas sp. MMSM20]|uniref:P-type conjugative transfer protein TrbG n=1 Tax=Sphingomonas lycopersici TaxID=2951807 RepID=UPI00223905B3|nr:P-type conjugative transfer protein TrbG [Sphingomonas lycopersici]MCW6531297.1 P-type conjugative transfer protein TrbG [Sphingomonas lycopersici]
MKLALLPALAGILIASSAGAQTRPARQAVQHVATANRAATIEPAPAGFVSGAQVYPFSEGTIFLAYAAPGLVTDIVLQPGEALIAVASGDTARWVIGDTTSGSGETRQTHVLVKPFSAGLVTNLVITTDRRAYHVRLVSTTATALSSMRWTYPQDELLALRRKAETERGAAPVAAGLSVETLHFNYAISGDKPAWRPLRAFDDGQKTYVEFPATLASGEAPPLFLVGSDGKAELVNYRVSGRFYVVDRIFDAAELRLGLKRQQVVRIDRVSSGAKRRGA